MGFGSGPVSRPRDQARHHASPEPQLGGDFGAGLPLRAELLDVLKQLRRRGGWTHVRPARPTAQPVARRGAPEPTPDGFWRDVEGRGDDRTSVAPRTISPRLHSVV